MPQDEDDLGTIRSQDWQIRADRADARRIGAAARIGFQAVYEGWQGFGISRDDVATQTAVEAQIAASCLGHKPLYFAPWAPQLAADLVGILRRVLPAGASVENIPSGLVVFRREVVRPILDSDHGFYRPNDKTDLAEIERVCANGNNGELLGYGVRNWFEPHGARVTITGSDGILFMFFVSNPHDALHFARERLRDIASYTLLPLEYDISPP